MSRNEIDPVKVIGELFPTTGPHTPEQLVNASLVIDELWRYLAHATYNRDNPATDDVVSVYMIAGNLGHSAHVAGQVYAQLSNACRRHAQRADLGHDNTESDPGVSAVEASVDLEDCQQISTELACNLDGAAQHLCHLYVKSDTTD